MKKHRKNIKILSALALLVHMLILSSCSTTEQGGQLEAGFATVDITPSDGNIQDPRPGL